MPTVDGIHRSPLWPDTRPEVIAINEITEGNCWCIIGWNVQTQRGRKGGPTKCLSSINACLFYLEIVLQNISPEPGVQPPISGISVPPPPQASRKFLWACLATLVVSTFSHSPALGHLCAWTSDPCLPHSLGESYSSSTKVGRREERFL